MKRLATGLSVAAVFAVLAALAACPGRPRIRPDAPQTAAASGDPAGTAASSGPSAEAAPPAIAPAPTPASPEAGDARLRDRRHLSPPSGEVTKELTAYTVEEHRLIAAVERKAGRIPPGVREVILRKRAGASREELEALARTSLAGDLVARATVLEWLGQEMGGTPAPAAPGEGAAPARPLVKPIGE